MNHFKHVRIISLLFLWGLSNVCSQPQILKSLKKLTSSEKFVVTNWSSNSGLPQNSINKICQDTNGIMWLATYGGLVRFDGTKFKTFSARSYPGIGSDRIYSIFSDSKNQLWISTEMGKLIRYDGKLFHNITTKLSSTFNAVAMAEDSQNALYIKSDSILYYYHKGKFEQVKLSLNGKFVERQVLYDIGNPIRSDTFIISQHGVISQVYHGRWIKSVSVTKPSPYNFSITATDFGYFFLNADKLYFSKTFEGLSKAKPLFPEYKFSKIHLFGSEILLSSSKSGIIKIDKNFKLSPLFTSEQIPTSLRTVFFTDMENNVWIGTETNGLYQIKKKFLYTINKPFGLESINTYPIFKSSNGDIWVGQNPGFFKIEKNKIVPWNQLHWEGPPVVWGITEDAEKNIWIASNGGGLHRFNKSGREDLSPLIEKEAGLLFFSAYKDSKDRLWFGSLGHTTKYENGKFTFYTPFGNNRNIYRQILEDNTGTLWFGSDLGLVKYSDDKFILLDSLKAQSARALYVDSKKRFWVGTYGNGIRIKVKDKFYSLRYKDGLFSDIVSSIVEDYKGNFWFTCNNGIFRIKEKEIDAFLSGKTENVNSLSYGNEEGLENIEFNGGCQPSWMRDDDGNLWFPSFSGPVVVDVNEVNNPQSKFTVLIENLTYKDSVFMSGDKIVLPADYTNFTINLIAPSYASSKNMRFKYRLLGNSEEWIDIGKKREVIFQKLPYGKYEFQVIASDSYGNWSVAPATISFAVEAIFWETPLFFALISLAIILIIVFFFYLKLKLATDHQSKLEKIIAERTLSLVEAKEKAEYSADEEKKLRSKAEEENRQKIELLRIVSHDLKNPVFAVQGFADMLLEDGVLNDDDKNVAVMIQEAGEQLKELITQLLAFSRFEGGQFNVDKTIMNVGSQISKIVERLKNQAERKKQNLYLNTSTKEIKISADLVLFEQIFENLISNAIKYSPAEKDILVSVNEFDGKVSLSVKDQGQGFSEADKANLYKPFVKLSSLPTGGESSSGLGLTIVKKFVEANDGTITLVSEKNEGAEFIVEFNIIK